MDVFALQTLLVFYDAAIRRTKSKAVRMLRVSIVACAIIGVASLASAFWFEGAVQTFLMLSAIVSLILLLPCTLWSAALVAREQRNQ